MTLLNLKNVEFKTNRIAAINSFLDKRQTLDKIPTIADAFGG